MSRKNQAPHMLDVFWCTPKLILTITLAGGYCHHPILQMRKLGSPRVLVILSLFVCAQSCPTLCNSMDGSPPSSSVHQIFQAPRLEWVAISYSKGSSQPRDQTCITCFSCMAGNSLLLCHLGFSVSLPAIHHSAPCPVPRRLSLADSTVSSLVSWLWQLQRSGWEKRRSGCSSPAHSLPPGNQIPAVLAATVPLTQGSWVRACN